MWFKMWRRPKPQGLLNLIQLSAPQSDWTGADRVCLSDTHTHTLTHCAVKAIGSR